MGEFADFLLEIGSEELPASVQPELSHQLAAQLTEQLKRAGLNFGTVHTFATPRRTAVLIEGLQTQQPAQTLERRGPAIANAFNADGTPTKAAEGFARSCNMTVAQLAQLKTPEGEWLVYRAEQKGQSTQTLLPQLIETAVSALSLAKPMRWGSGEAAFVRPIHWVVGLLGETVLDGHVLGTPFDRITYGHRIHAPLGISLTQPNLYETTLQQAFVIADFDKRQQQIQQQLPAAALIQEDAALLKEVTGLVEWPTVMTGNFDAAFLQVPKEALIAAMKSHQKCFPMFDNSGALLPSFVFAANLNGKSDLIIHGNERVIAARLADAAFFYHEDKKYRLESRLDLLANVVFQKGLGTLKDKTERLKRIAQNLVITLNLDVKLQAAAEAAAALAKCDLVSTMVGEFPELQGIMGSYYAKQDGEPEAVAIAIGEQYLPIPKTDLGAILALADRLDTLVGIFALGQKPTGDKDPFGLRRAALGVLRILIDRNWALPHGIMQDLLPIACDTYSQLNSEGIELSLLDFFRERFRVEYKNYAPDILQAVLNNRDFCPVDALKKLAALEQFKQSPDVINLAAANKRINNILKAMSTAELAENLLEAPAECALAQALKQQEAKLPALVKEQKYTEALQSLAQLRPPVDKFFDEVMVMVDNPDLRNNRLALLFRLRQLLTKIADLSLLQS